MFPSAALGPGQPVPSPNPSTLLWAGPWAQGGDTAHPLGAGPSLELAPRIWSLGQGQVASSLTLRSQTVEILLNSLVIENPVDDQGHPGRLALMGTRCHPFTLLGVCSVVMTSPGDLGGTFDTHDFRTGLVLGGEVPGWRVPTAALTSK